MKIRFDLEDDDVSVQIKTPMLISNSTANYMEQTVLNWIKKLPQFLNV